MFFKRIVFPNSLYFEITCIPSSSDITYQGHVPVPVGRGHYQISVWQHSGQHHAHFFWFYHLTVTPGFTLASAVAVI